MAENDYPLENQFDIIHVIDMGHLVFVDKDEKSGILLYECPRCHRRFIFSEYVEEQEPVEVPEEQPQEQKPKRNKKSHKQSQQEQNQESQPESPPLNSQENLNMTENERPTTAEQPN